MGELKEGTEIFMVMVESDSGSSLQITFLDRDKAEAWIERMERLYDNAFSLWIEETEYVEGMFIKLER